MLSRILAGVIMWGVALAVSMLATATAAFDAKGAVLVVTLLSAAALVAIVVSLSRSTSARVAWGRLCLVDGAMSVALGIASLVLNGQADRPPGFGYGQDIERSVGPMPLPGAFWAHATYLGIAVVALGAILFALSYWLFAPNHRHERQAH
jgi:hypothetical protein